MKKLIISAIISAVVLAVLPVVLMGAESLWIEKEAAKCGTVSADGYQDGELELKVSDGKLESMGILVFDTSTFDSDSKVVDGKIEVYCRETMMNKFTIVAVKKDLPEKSGEEFLKHVKEEAVEISNTTRLSDHDRNKFELNKKAFEVINECISKGRKLIVAFKIDGDKCKTVFAGLDRIERLRPTIILKVTGKVPEEAASGNGKGKYPFGTVTSKSRTPGDLDCKGDCRNLKQGGYMYFDLSGYPVGKKVRTASLKVYVKKVSKNPWIWMTHIPMDPRTSDVSEVFKAIQKHSAIISHARKLGAVDDWANIKINSRGIKLIEKALAEKDPKKRFFAVAVTFE